MIHFARPIPHLPTLKSESMRIFLTGATGFIGSHVLRLALDEGHTVLALRRPGSEPRVEISGQPKWCEGCMEDDWGSELEGCDALIHTAAHGVATGGDSWDDCFWINVNQSLHLWKEAASAGVKRLVICGSCFEYGLSGLSYEKIPTDAPLIPTSAYGASKAAATLAAQALAINMKLELVVMRLFHIFGEGEAEGRFWPSLVRAANQGSDLPMTEGDQVRDFTPAQFAAQCLLNACDSSKLVLRKGIPLIQNIGTGNAQSLKQFATHEWKRLGAHGKLLTGALSYRSDEVMRYVPEVTK